MIRQAKLSEELGFDSIWIEEHHEDGNYWPTPLLAIAVLSSVTKRTILGTNILILPLYDPVHIAEQLAVLDVMTQGRIILGTSIGDSSDEFAMFRVQANRRGRTFEEQIQVIRLLWEGGRIYFSGAFITIKHQLSVTLPIRRPPVWIGGWVLARLKERQI
jgi:alkanesulfonate monooxygenase SsuD/methylene tetrahydromethanopterin reductase-like flavin-dependent oxidoreductase (luciferase family)